jgi:hypothetical protein
VFEFLLLRLFDSHVVTLIRCPKKTGNPSKDQLASALKWQRDQLENHFDQPALIILGRSL